VNELVLEDSLSVNIARRFCGVGGGVGVGAVAGAPSSGGMRTGARGVSSGEKMPLGGRGEGGRVGERRPVKLVKSKERAAIP
jgi:hypothetical protein